MIVLDALLTVGVLLNIVNGVGLLLGLEGRQALAARSARVADRLETARPIRHLEPLVTGRYRTRLLLFGIGEFVVALGADVLVDYWDGSLEDVGSFGALLYAAAIAASVAALPLLDHLGEPKLMRWLLGDERFLPFLRRFVQFCVIGVVVLAAYQGALWGAGVALGVGNLRTVVALPIDRVGPVSALLGVGFVLGAPALVYYSIISQLGASAVLLTALAWVGTRSLTLVRGPAAWLLRDRKAAWAVAVLAATVGLGMVKLALTTGA
jgi:hypothetical protein